MRQFTNADMPQVVTQVMTNIRPSGNSRNGFSDSKIGIAIVELYLKRTREHIENVKKYALKIAELYPGRRWADILVKNVEHHDEDKLSPDIIGDYAPYIVFRYSGSDLSKKFDLTEEYKHRLDTEILVAHCKQSKHHPEYWDRNYGLTKFKPPYIPQGMDEANLAEMCADWFAVGHEQNNTALSWYQKTNKDRRWLWSAAQAKFIEDILSHESQIVDPNLSFKEESSIHQNVAVNIEHGLVYHGSPVKLPVLKKEAMGKWYRDPPGVFVSPFKSIAMCFAVGKDVLIEELEKQGCDTRSINFKYDVWLKDLDDLRQTPDIVTIRVRGAGNYKPFTGTTVGYVYTIDYNKYKKKAAMFSLNPESNVEFMIRDDITPMKIEQIKIKYEVLPPLENSTEQMVPYKGKDWNESMINSVKDLKSFYRDCRYGLVVNGRPWAETHNSTELEEYDKYWRLQTTKEILASRCGTCWDTAILSHYFFTKWGIQHKFYFSASKRSAVDDKYADDPTHAFVIYKDDIQSYRLIDFPAEEIPTLSSQSRIITTRVSADYARFNVDDIVRTPWGRLFKVTKYQPIHDVKEHPYCSELTESQRMYLSKFSKIAVLTLEEYKFVPMWKWIEGSWGPYIGNRWEDKSAESLMHRIAEALAKYDGHVVDQEITEITSFPPYGCDTHTYCEYMWKRNKHVYDTFYEKVQSNQSLVSSEAMYAGTDIRVHKCNAKEIVKNIKLIAECDRLAAKASGDDDVSTTKEILDYIRKWKAEVYVFLKGSSMIGCAMCSVEHKEDTDKGNVPESWVSIHDVGVLEKYQGKGYGQACLKLLCKALFSSHKSINVIALGVYNKNVRAAHVYESMGFKPMNWWKSRENTLMGLSRSDFISTSNESMISFIKDVKALCDDLHTYDANIIDYTKGSPRVATELKTDEERLEVYRLQDPKDTEKFRCGFCWDISLLAINKLAKLGYGAHAVYMEQNDGSEFPNNHVTVVYKDNGGLMVFEPNLGSKHGLYGPYKSDVDVCKRLAANLYSPGTKDVWGGKNNKWTFYRLDTYPKVKSTVSEFITQARHGTRLGEYDSRDSANHLQSAQETLNLATKKISFPKKEIQIIKKQNRIITTRVSSDYDKFDVGDIVETPWNVLYRVDKRQNITDIKDHPYYKELTEDQVDLLSRYSKIAVLTLIIYKESKEAFDASMLRPIRIVTDVKESMSNKSFSMESIPAKYKNLVFETSPVKKKVYDMARRYYTDTGSHGYEHIKEVLTTAYVIKGKKDLTDMEYTAILYHDVGRKFEDEANGKFHNVISEQIARKELPKLGVFTDDELEQIYKAVLYHRGSWRKENGIDDSQLDPLSELVTNADKGFPQTTFYDICLRPTLWILEGNDATANPEKMQRLHNYTTLVDVAVGVKETLERLKKKRFDKTDTSLHARVFAKDKALQIHLSEIITVKDIMQVVKDVCKNYGYRVPNDKPRFEIYGAILGCLGSNAKKVSYTVTEDLPDDPWAAIIKSSTLLTADEVALWHKYHVVDVDHKGVPYYFIVKDFVENKEYVWYTDDNKPMPINTPQEIVKAKEAGRSKHLVEEQLDFDSVSTESYSTESINISTEAAESIKVKRKKIEEYIISSMKLLDRHTDTNTTYWKNFLSSLSDADFDKFMNCLKNGTANIHMYVPPLIVKLRNAELIDAAHKLGVKLMHRIWMTDAATGMKYLTPEEYLVVQLPVRRQQQFLDEKISVPDDDKTIDGLTGQVTGDSKACAITNPEIHIMQARNLDASLYEYANVRGGNIHNYAEFKRSLEETGSVSLNQLDPSNKTRVSVMGQVLLTGMGLDVNISEI